GRRLALPRASTSSGRNVASSRSIPVLTSVPLARSGTPAASTSATMRSVSSIAPLKNVTNCVRTFVRSASLFVELAKTALAFARWSSHMASAEHTEPVYAATPTVRGAAAVDVPLSPPPPHPAAATTHTAASSVNASLTTACIVARAGSGRGDAEGDRGRRGRRGVERPASGRERHGDRLLADERRAGQRLGSAAGVAERDCARGRR